MWNTDWKADLPSLIATLVPVAQSGGARRRAIRCPIASMAASVGAGVSVRSTLCPWEHQGVAAGERPDVEAEVVVVLVDAGRTLATISQNTHDIGPP